MLGRRWLYALTCVVAVELVFAVLVLIAEVREHGPGTRFAVAGLVWVGVGVPVAAGCARALFLARRELDRRAEVLTAASSTSHDWVWESDADDHLTHSNDAVTDLLGYRPDEVIGVRSVDLLYDETARQVAAPFLGVANPPSGGWSDIEVRWRHRDGSPVRMLGSAAPIHGHRGQIVGFRGTRRLVSEDLHPRETVRDARARIGDVLARGGVQVALQPIVELASGRVLGVEALARFADGRGPDAWFRDAHLADRTRDLDELTFASALALLERVPAAVYLSVNASPELLMDGPFRTRLLGCAMPLHRLVIEITEHARVGDYDQLNDAIAPLRERGVRFAIDDTGAGYASLSHVLRLSPDMIKLDRDLIGNLEGDRARRSLVTALVLLALDVGASVTGEGVETTGQREALETLGVDQAQGYLLGRPTTDLVAWQEWWTRRPDARMAPTFPPQADA